MRRSDWIWLTAILVIAIALRGYKLESGLWYDEIVTLVDFVRLPVSGIITNLSSMNNHILFSLEAKAAVQIFGESAWSLRLPAMLLGVGCVAALWWFARKLVGPSQANFAALLLAVSYHHVWFSQNARGYTGLMFWAIVGTSLFIQGLKQPSWRIWIGYAFVVGAAGYTHLSAGFFFAVHGLVYLLLLSRRGYLADRMKPLVGLVLGGALVLILHAPVLPQVTRSIQNVSASTSVVVPPSERPVSEWKNPLWTLLEIGRNMRSLGGVATLGLPAVLAFFLIGAGSLGRRQPEIIVILLLHIPLTLIALVAMSFRIWPRYFIIDLAFIFLLVVHGVFVFAEYLSKAVPIFKLWNLNGERLGRMVSAAAVICSLFLLPANYRFPKQDFVGARDFVLQSRAPQDVVVSVGLASMAFSRYYAPDWRVAESWPEIQNMRSASSHVWVIYTSPLHMSENHPDVLAGLTSEFDRVKFFPGTLGGGEVLVYRSRDAIPNAASQ
jgi:mannosyltransferase